MKIYNMYLIWIIYLLYGDHTNTKIMIKEDLELFKGFVLLKNMDRNKPNWYVVLFHENMNLFEKILIVKE